MKILSRPMPLETLAVQIEETQEELNSAIARLDIAKLNSRSN